MSNEPCHCGRPIQDTAALCPHCGDTMRDQLNKIADRWGDLEEALTRIEVGGEKAHSKKSMVASGTPLNEKVVQARRACTDVVWFAVQVLRDDFDTAGREFSPPPTSANRTQDDTPVLARWLASWHVSHFTHGTSEETAVEIARDVATAEHLTWQALKEPLRRVPTGLPCEQHTTSDLGERVPCAGVMHATLTEQMPDLVCSEDAAHRIPPDVWSRQYWKRNHDTTRVGEAHGKR